MSDDFFAPPPFKPDEALQRIRKELRSLGLSERAGQFELRGQVVARATVDANGLNVALVREPARSPQWQARVLTDSATLRDWLALVKTQLTRWRDRDE